jgi:predicted nucleic acid-binding protein
VRLLDSHVIAELIKPAPDRSVLAYVGALAPETGFTAAICEAEICFGLARLPAGQRRADLASRIGTWFASGFPNQVLPFGSLCASHYGAIRAAREAAGSPIAVEDAMIAATAHAHGHTVATRNVDDFQGCGAAIVDPWRAG